MAEGSDFLLIVIGLQILVGFFIVIILGLTLQRDMLMLALEKSASAFLGNPSDITILAACAVPGVWKARIVQALALSYPSAKIEWITTRGFLGGIAIQCGEEIFDFTLDGRLKHLWGAAE